MFYMIQTNKQITNNNKALLTDIVFALQEKKAKNIISLKFDKVNAAMFDSFVICTATSNTHATALFDNVALFVKQHLGILPNHTEGVNNAQWILMDYFDVLVHIFLPDSRQFYNIEGLWGDAVKTIYNEE